MPRSHAASQRAPGAGGVSVREDTASPGGTSRHGDGAEACRERRAACLTPLALACLLAAPLAAPGDDEASGGGPPAAQEPPPLEAEARVEVDALRSVSGGREVGGVVQRLLAVGASADLERALGWTGARAHVQVLAFGGGSLSDRTGDLQIAAINEGPRRTILGEAWVEQRWGDDAWRLRLGKTDANNEFAAVPTGTLFSDGSFGNSPTIFVLPTYPDPAFGANLEWRPVERTSVKVGVYDGATANGISTGNHGLQTDEDLFLATEIALSWGDEASGGDGRVSLGAWRHTADFARFSGGEEDGTSGTWVTLDQDLWRGAGDERVSVFLQAGLADDDVTEFERHLGGGVVWADFVPGQSVGVGVSRVELTDAPAARPLHDHETAVEAWWRWQVDERFRIQPTVIAIRQPALAEDDALVVGCRFLWDLSPARGE